jgi:hypothetical protein
MAMGGLAVGTLTVFHALLLAERLRDQSILEPAVALQWAGTVALLGFLVWLRRQGVPLLRGRAALAFWLLVLLLHLVPATPATLADWEHTDLLLALPASGMVSLVVALTALAVLAGTRLPLLRPATWHRGRQDDPPPLEPGVRSRLCARPPPPARIG